MFIKRSEGKDVAVTDLITRKTQAYGEKTLLSEFRLAKGADLAAHSHPHEQTGYLVSGKLIFTVGSEEFCAEPGDGWCFEGGLEHAARAEEDCLVIEVFAPVREEFLP